MCGLSGYAGIRSGKVRHALVSALGWGIDKRGGHAAGYAVMRHGKVKSYRCLGEWSESRRAFRHGAADADICMMHARFATHGAAGLVSNAHPFEVVRGGYKLTGSHNGIIYDAEESAVLHGRKMTVDSKEVYELLADGEEKYLATLSGYGVLTWFDSRESGMLMARLSDSGQIYACSLHGGGLVWGSTEEIVQLGLVCGDVREESAWDIEVGKVYRIMPNGGISIVPKRTVKVASGAGGTKGWFSRYMGDSDEEWEKAYTMYGGGKQGVDQWKEEEKKYKEEADRRGAHMYGGGSGWRIGDD